LDVCTSVSQSDHFENQTMSTQGTKCNCLRVPCDGNNCLRKICIYCKVVKFCCLYCDNTRRTSQELLQHVANAHADIDNARDIVFVKLRTAPPFIIPQHDVETLSVGRLKEILLQELTYLENNEEPVIEEENNNNNNSNEPAANPSISSQPLNDFIKYLQIIATPFQQYYEDNNSAIIKKACEAGMKAVIKYSHKKQSSLEPYKTEAQLLMHYCILKFSMSRQCYDNFMYIT